MDDGTDGTREDRADDAGGELAALVASAAEGSQAAWQAIVARYTPMLARVVRGYRLGGAQAEDVAQTVWLRLVEQLASLHEPRALPAWLVTTARREALRAAAGRNRVRPLDLGSDDTRLATHDDPDVALDRVARHDALVEGFALLPVRQRELMVLLVQDPPLSYARISGRSGIPVGAIGPTRARAIARLRRTPSVAALLTTSGAGVGAPRPV